MVEAYKPGAVTLRPVTDNRRTGPGAEAFGAEIGRATQGLGQSLDSAADVASRIADSQAETRVREADVALSTRIQEELTTGPNALMKLQGQTFVDKAPEYLKRIEDHAKELTSQPRNGLEARMLGDLTSRRLAEARQQIGSQSVREAQFANKAAAAARTDVLAQGAAFNYRNAQAFQRGRSEMDAAIRDELHTKGIDDPLSFQAMRAEKLGIIHSYAVQDMIRLGETGAAQSWLDKAIIDREIDPAAASQLQTRLETAATEHEIGALVEGDQPPSIVDGTTTRVTPELRAAVRFQESRGNGMAVSPTGAKGVMQVQPDTGPEAARLAGLPWQPERMHSNRPEDIEYQQTLGDAYLGQQLKTFKGVTVAALAAYNAGPGMVQDWIDGTNLTKKNPGKLKLGDPAVNPRVWANAIPFSETKAYVAAITAKLGGSTRAPLPPGIMNVADVEPWVKQFPVQDRDKARSAAIAVVNRNRSAKAQREADTWDAVQPYLRNGGNWTNIPKQLWNRVDPEHQTALMEAERKGTDRVTSPEALDGLMAIMERDPQGFADMDLLKAAPDFSRSDFEQIRMWQHQARTGTGEWKRPVAQYSSITRLAPAIVPPSMLKSTGKADLAQLKARWYEAMKLKQDTQKEPLTDDEIGDIGARLVAQTATSGGMLGGKTQPLFKFGVAGGMVPTAEYKAIPVEEQSKVFRFLQQRTGKVPTTAEVLETWRTLKATGDI